MNRRKKKPNHFAVGQYADPKWIESTTLARFLERFDALQQEFGLVIDYDEITNRLCIFPRRKDALKVEPNNTWVTEAVAAEWEGK